MNLPANDVTLLTTTANLVVRSSLHPALAYLLLKAAKDVHKSATLLNKPGEFLHPCGTDFPLANEAQHYCKDGRPFLQRWLPYWAANALQRWLLILIALLAIAIPVVKVIAQLMDYRGANRLHRRYRDLLAIEARLSSQPLSATDTSAVLAQLEQIGHNISHAKVPLVSLTGSTPCASMWILCGASWATRPLLVKLCKAANARRCWRVEQANW